MKLSGPLLRVSILLFVVSFVGLIGLNGSIDPTRVHTAKAAALDIVLTSNAQDSLQFQLDPAPGGCWDFLAPGDACFANVVVTNVGEETAEISPPTATVSGPLHTCTGDIAGSPGSGGANITLSITDATYSNPVTLLDPGDTESFNVNFTLADVGNGCQGLSATIVVEILIGLPPATPTPTPSPTPTEVSIVDDDDPDPTATNTPVNQTGGVQVTPTPTSTRVDQIGNVIATPTRVNEVLPTRLPVTGLGAPEPTGGLSTLDVLFLSLGGLALTTLFLALAARQREAQR